MRDEITLIKAIEQTETAVFSKINTAVNNAIRNGEFRVTVDLCPYIPSAVFNQVVKSIRSTGIYCEGEFITEDGESFPVLTIVWGDDSEPSDNYHLRVEDKSS